MQRRSCGVIGAAGRGLGLIVDGLSRYGHVKYLRIYESRGGFRSLAENNGQAGGLPWGAGTMALVRLRRSFQPFLCCPVRIQTTWRADGTQCQLRDR